MGWDGVRSGRAGRRAAGLSRKRRGEAEGGAARRRAGRSEAERGEAEGGAARRRRRGGQVAEKARSVSK